MDIIILLVVAAAWWDTRENMKIIVHNQKEIAGYLETKQSKEPTHD